MKSILLIAVTLFSFNALSDIKLTGVQGVMSIQGAGNSLALTVDSNSSKELELTFLSTEQMGIPRLTFVSLSGASVVLPTVADKAFTTAVNEEVTLRIPANQICTQLSQESGAGCYVTAVQIGMDANSDGDLGDSDDDSFTFTVAF